LKAEFVHLSKQDKKSEDQKLRLMHNLRSTESFCLTDKLQNGVIVHFREHLDGFVFPFKSNMENSEETFWKFAIGYTIYVHGGLGLTRFRQCTCRAGKEMQWTMIFGTILRACCSQTSGRMTGFLVSIHMQSIIDYLERLRNSKGSNC
jgi:hypothetical protein